MVKTREEKNECQRQYRQNNKEKIAEKRREYRQNNKEQIAEYTREYYQNNKEQITERAKEYNQNNKEKLAEYKREYDQNNKEKVAEYHKIYGLTPAGKKVNMMADWRRSGVNNVNEEMYNHYIATTHCECCLKEFSSSRDRCLDHDHETGEYRQILCSSCNNHDYWKKIIHLQSQY